MPKKRYAVEPRVDFERRLLWNEVGNHGRNVDPIVSVTQPKKIENCKLFPMSAVTTS